MSIIKITLPVKCNILKVDIQIDFCDSYFLFKYHVEYMVL